MEDEERVDSSEDRLLESTSRKKKTKVTKCGIIYLSRVPTLMNVTIIRRHFERFGEVGKIFLQPDNKAASRGKRSRAFSEGWVEFMDKKVAKFVAATLNNTLIGGKKKNRWREEIWNIKYLHRFQWAHLNERLAYEKAIHSQRMRTEIAQAKRQASFYIENAERNERRKRIEQKKLKRGMDTEDQGDGGEDRVYQIRLKETEEEIVSKRKQSVKETGKKKKKQKVGDKSEKPSSKAFLTKIFSSGLEGDDND